MENRQLANLAIDNFVLGEDAHEWKHVYISNSAVPTCNWDNKTISSPVLPPLLDPVADAVVRGKNAHEAGHGRLTRANKNPSWSALKSNVVNVLEDLRIERGVGRLSDSLESDLRTMNHQITARLQKEIQNHPGALKPGDEAMLALSMAEQGIAPLWRVSDKAQGYISAAKAAFAKWRDVDCDTPAGFAEIEKIADEVVACFEEEKEQQKKQQQGQSQKQGGQQQGNKQKGEQGKGEQQAQEGEGGESQESAGQSNQDKGAEEKKSQSAESGKPEEEKKAESKQGKSGSEGEKGEKGETDNGRSVSERSESKQDSQSNKEASGCSDDFSDRNLADEALQAIIKEKVDDAQSRLGDYTAYTLEDEVRLADENQSEYERAKAAAAGMVAKLRSHLEQSLKSASRCKTISGRDSGDLDASMLPYLAKNLPRDVFFDTIKGISLDTTVSILIDESGSIGSTCRTFRTLAIAFSEALERLGVKYEVLGHTTKSYRHTPGVATNRTKPMVIFEHKRFNMPLRRERNRLGSISSYNCNVDGEALLETWKRAKAQRANRHLVFVLTDGVPNGAESPHANIPLYHHLKRTVQYIRQEGGEVYAIGIGTKEPEQFYGEKFFLYAANSSEITHQFFRQVSEAIAKGARK